MDFPAELRYTEEHEWIRYDGGKATIGVTEYAQQRLGDVVFVEMPEKGLVLERGSNAAEIESVKAVGDLIMPLSGEIIEINEKLADSPEIVNTSPYEDGWIIKIKFSHSDELKDLLSHKDYKLLIESEEQ